MLSEFYNFDSKVFMFLSIKDITYPARKQGDNLRECKAAICHSSRTRRTVDSSITFNLPVENNVDYKGLSFCRKDESTINIHFRINSHNDTHINYAFRDQESNDEMFTISKFFHLEKIEILIYFRLDRRFQKLGWSRQG